MGLVGQLAGWILVPLFFAVNYNMDKPAKISIIGLLRYALVF